jgi:hypothetical protein
LEFRPRSSEAPAPGETPQGTGRLIALWHAGLIIAALLTYWAMGAQSAVLSSALAGAAIAIPLLLLGHTMRSYGPVLNSHVLVPAIGPIVILVLIVEYVEYNRHLDEAHSAQLIPAELLSISDVKLARAKAGTPRVTGHVANRSPHELIGMSLELMLYGGSHELGGAQAEAKLDVAPGEQGDFTVMMPRMAATENDEVPCERADSLPPAPPSRPDRVQCFFRVTGTRGIEVFF